jgi:hypothetical protein
MRTGVTVYEENLDGTREAVAEAWAGYLGQPVGPGDDLLAMGAHSLMMALVADRIHENLGVSVPLELCFEAPLFDDYAGEIHRLRQLPPVF